MEAGVKEPRRHHYVPRTYLKNFAVQEKNEWRIRVMDKTKNRSYMANIKDVAVERDFYRIDSKDEEFFWEHYYAEQIESLIPTTFSRVVAICTLSVNKSTVIDDETKLRLAKIICSQLLRTKKSREFQFEIGQRTANNVLDTVRKQFEGLLSDEKIDYLDNFKYDEMLNKTMCLPIINEEARIGRFIDFLLKRYWVVFKNINYNRSPLITSDHPVTFYNILTQKTDFSNNGLAIPHTAIFFPINCELVIGLYTHDIYFNTMFELNNRMLIVDDVPFVEKLNRIQYEQCYRQAYSSFR